MAFVSLFFAAVTVIMGVLTITTGIAVAFYVIAGLLAVIAKRKAKKASAVYNRPVSVLVLRIFGTIFMVPLIMAAGFMAYTTISSKIENYNNLGYAVQSGNVEEAERLLKKGIDPDCAITSKEHVKEGQDTILLSVVSCGKDYAKWRKPEMEERLKIAKLLIQYGADVNAVHIPKDCENSHIYEDEPDQYARYDTCGFTPIMYAVEEGNPEMIRLLVENGADLQAVDKCGYNVLCVAADNYSDSPEELQIITYLLDHGADPDVETNYRQDVPFLAYRHVTNGERENHRVWEMLAEYNSASPFSVENHVDDMAEEP